MGKICPKCETGQKRAHVEGMHGMFALSLKKNNFLVSTTNSVEVIPYVCPKCGYVEFYAYGIEE